MLIDVFLAVLSAAETSLRTPCGRVGSRTASSAAAQGASWEDITPACRRSGHHPMRSSDSRPVAVLAGAQPLPQRHRGSHGRISPQPAGAAANSPCDLLAPDPPAPHARRAGGAVAVLARARPLPQRHRGRHGRTSPQPAGAAANAPCELLAPDSPAPPVRRPGRDNGPPAASGPRPAEGTG